jgi:triphosphoribosyl-dephospho-CoA synthetase
MVLYEYDGNAIMAEATKNRTAIELLRAFKIMEQKLIARGLKSRLTRLDNEASLLLNIIYMNRTPASNWYRHTVTEGMQQNMQ